MNGNEIMLRHERLFVARQVRKTKLGSSPLTRKIQSLCKFRRACL